MYETDVSNSPWRDLPQDKRTRIHIYPKEGVLCEIDRPIKHFRRHVTSRTDLAVRVTATMPSYKHQS